jgi:hypothetical protein
MKYLVGIMIMVTSLSSCNYQVLAGELEFISGSSHIIINPCKVEVNDATDISIQVTNASNSIKKYKATIRTPDNIPDGYTVLTANSPYAIFLQNTEFTLTANTKHTLRAIILKVGDEPGKFIAWISILEINEQVQSEVICKVLLNS